MSNETFTEQDFQEAMRMLYESLGRQRLFRIPEIGESYTTISAYVEQLELKLERLERQLEEVEDDE